MTTKLEAAVKTSTALHKAEQADQAEKAHTMTDYLLKDKVKNTNPKDSIGSTKAALSVVPFPPLMEAALGMLEGDRKYGRHNYRVAGVRNSVYFDAVMRHMIAWWEGQDIDPDSGLHHLAKAIASLLVVRDAQIRGMCTDDRPPKVPDDWFVGLNERVKEIIARYPDRKEPVTEDNQVEWVDRNVPK